MAVYTKVHHAAIDGVSGNDILAAVLDLTPEGATSARCPPVAVRQGARAVRCSPAARSPGRAAGARRKLGRAGPLAARPGRQPGPAEAARSSTASCPRRGASAVLSQTGLRARARRSTGRSGRTAAGRSARARWPTSRRSRTPAAAPSTTSSWRCAPGALRAGWPTTTRCPTAAGRRGARSRCARGREGQGRQPGLDDDRAAADAPVRPGASGCAHCHEAMRAAKEQHGALPGRPAVRRHAVRHARRWPVRRPGWRRGCGWSSG
jgi:hypothetical protein